MSINNIHEDLIRSLESAVDMGKFLGVFSTLVGIIKDQQSKIDELSVKSETMAEQLADTKTVRRPSIQKTSSNDGSAPSNDMVQMLEDKINALETKLNDTLLELHGLGEDSSILDREEQPPDYFTLPSNTPTYPSSSKFIASAPAIEEAVDEDDDGSPIGFESRQESAVASANGSAAPSAVASKRSSFKDISAQDQDYDEEENKNNEVKNDDTKSGGSDIKEEEDAEVVAATDETLAESNVADGKQNDELEDVNNAESQEQEGNNDKSAVVSAQVSKAPSPVHLDESESEVHDETGDGVALAPEKNDDIITQENDAVKSRSHSPVLGTPSEENKKQKLPGSRPGSRSSSPSPLPPSLPRPTRTDSGEDQQNNNNINNNNHPPARSSSLVSAGSVTKPGLLTVTPMELRPSAMRESFSTKLQEAEHELFPNRDSLLTPKSSAISKALLAASFAAGDESLAQQHPHLYRRILKHYFKYHIDSKLPYERLVALSNYRTLRAHDHRDKMNANNLVHISPEKRWKLVRMLRQKGRFIQISRNMLEDSRQKYAARSLKQNVEYVEAETRRLFNKVSAIKDILRRQHTEMRYLLPLDFHETFDRLVDFLEHLELKGGVEEIMALPSSDKIMCYDQSGQVPQTLIDSISKQLKETVMQEMGELKTQIKTLQDEALTHSQLADLMQPESDSKSTHKSSGRFGKEKDLARARTIDLIKECISQERKKQKEEERLEAEREKQIAAAEQANRATAGSVMQEITFHSPATQHKQEPTPHRASSMILIQERIDTANKDYIDEKVRSLEEQLTTIRLNLDSNKEASSNDLAFITAKLESLEAASALMQQHDAEVREQHKKDSEALKIMQKRLANVSIDNVLDELRVLQLQVNDRPSTSDVGNMMEGISHTFRKHLGENVIGLRSLVDQVYRQIHHKVNREDIKTLISAKLSQMEQDILRREEEMFSAASSTRCMSCGQLPADPTNAFVNHTAARHTGNQNYSHHNHNQPHTSQQQQQYGEPHGAHNSVVHGGSSSSGTGVLKSGHRPNSSPSAPSSQHEYSPFRPTDASSAALVFNPSADVTNSAPLSRARSDRMDDEISLHSEHSFNNVPASLQSTSQVLGPVRSDEIYAVVTGSAGLKSLMPQHPPMQPIRQPYNNNHINNNNGAVAQNAAKKASKRTERVPEPLYRKAKMAAHMKEMVKISTPSAQNYGFTPNNPFFVMDGYVDDEANPHINFNLESGTSSLHSRGSGGARRPRTQGSQSPQQQVYVPIPRSNANPNSPTQQLLMSASTNAVGDHVDNISVGTVLPYIVNKG